jgi:hypothetical protein
VSLICRFVPKGGQLIVSEQSRHLLAGPAPPLQAQSRAEKPKPSLTPNPAGVQQVAYQWPVDGSFAPGVDAGVNPPAITTATFQLPANFGRAVGTPITSAPTMRHGPTLLASQATGIPGGVPSAGYPGGTSIPVAAQPTWNTPPSAASGVYAPPQDGPPMAAGQRGYVTSPRMQANSPAQTRPGAPRTTVAATSSTKTAPGWNSPALQRPNHFARSQSPAPSEQTAPQGRDPAWWQQRP